ncbi:low temperature requirement A [Chytriomyces cf. hyalinus JEL632]|nr:low temperature requirement A [Chytriomyces cf. hyalinus JEL632]
MSQLDTESGFMSVSAESPPGTTRNRRAKTYIGGSARILDTVHTPMVARDPAEAHRASTPLELLFDLTMVVAVATVSAEFDHYIIEGGSIGPAVVRFCFSFMSIWIAWLGFVWFGTGYDVDDALFRLGTLGQMVGVLVIANGIPTSFKKFDYAQLTYGFVIMRVFYIFLFRLRAAYQHRATRAKNLKYAGLTFLLQLGWVGRLYLPQTDAWIVTTFTLLGVCELIVPFVAENGSSTNAPFHPHHVAERYGLFTIIVLGEVILSVSNAARLALDGNALNGETIKIGLGGMIILFCLWWLYFLIPFGHLLAKNTGRGFLWGYLHLAIHGPIAAFAAGLAIVVQASSLKDATNSTKDGIVRRASGGTSTASASGSGVIESIPIKASDISKTGLMVVAISVSLFIFNLNVLLLMLTKFRWKVFGPKVVGVPLVAVLYCACWEHGGCVWGGIA